MLVKHDTKKLGANANKSYKNLYKKIIIYIFYKVCIVSEELSLKMEKPSILLKFKSKIHCMWFLHSYIPNIHSTTMVIN